MPVKNNKFSNFISSIEYIKDSVKKPFKKYFDEATSLYVSRKIEKKPKFLTQ